MNYSYSFISSNEAYYVVNKMVSLYQIHINIIITHVNNNLKIKYTLLFYSCFEYKIVLSILFSAKIRLNFYHFY